MRRWSIQSKCGCLNTIRRRGMASAWKEIIVTKDFYIYVVLILTFDGFSKHIFNGCSTYVYFMFLTREAVLFLRSIDEEFFSVPKLEHPKQMMEFLFFGDHFYYLSSHCLQYLSTCHFRSSLWVLQREQLKTLTGLLDAKERYSVVIIYYFLSLSFFWLLIFIISLSWSAFLSFPPTAYWVSW